MCLSPGPGFLWAQDSLPDLSHAVAYGIWGEMRIPQMGYLFLAHLG
jgi:hypothetical protein